jgi:hypothetical protein
VPVWAIAGLTALFVAGLWTGNHFATGLVERGARARAARTQGPTQDSAWPLLTAALRTTPPSRIRAPRWRRGPTVLALMLKDLRLSWRRTSAWRPWPVWLVLAPASALAWWFATMPGGLEPTLGRFVAFGLALVAAAALADSLIALAARDPAPVLKSLPLHAGDVWLSRFLLVLGFTAALTAGHAVAARWLPAGPLQVHLIWLAAATLAIGMLGVHYGMTMPPGAAARVLTLTLTIATAASIMIPLLGWILLLAAVIHSARRVPRWSYLEEIP